jgi:hypothetical protein
LTNIQVARLLVTSPGKAFAALKESPLFALPMWLLILCTAGTLALYYAGVDIAWMQDQMATQAKLNPDQAAAFRISRPVILWGSVIGVVVALMVVQLISALYFLVAGNITNVRYSFRHWFAFSWWVGTPQILGAIPALLILLLTDTSQLDASALNPLSLNELVFHRKLGEPGYSFLTSIGLIHIAVWWLSVVGLKVWSGRSTLFCAVFALLPSVLIYGIWALFAFR